MAGGKKYPKPWYRRSRGVWYVQLGRRQINLGPDEAAAWAEYHRLMEAEAGDGTGPVGAGSGSVEEVFGEFLEWVEGHRAPATYDWYREFCRSFIDYLKRHHPRIGVAEIKPLMVSKWVDLHADRWNSTSRAAAIGAIQRALNWAVRQDLIAANPIKGRVEKPARRRREFYLSDTDRVYLLGKLQSPFRELFEILVETGCRPGDACRVEARHCDLAAGVWIFAPDEHKTGQRTGQPKVVYLSPRALELTAAGVHRYPAGPIFRNSRGRPWTPNAIRCRLRRWQDEIPGLCAYGCRHGYATRALTRGVDVETLRVLMGHEDTTMISRHYSHIAKQMEYLREAAKRVAE